MQLSPTIFPQPSPATPGKIDLLQIVMIDALSLVTTYRYSHVKLYHAKRRKLLFFTFLLLKIEEYVNPLNANPEKWSNTLKQIVGKLPTIC